MKLTSVKAKVNVLNTEMFCAKIVRCVDLSRVSLKYDNESLFFVHADRQLLVLIEAFPHKIVHKRTYEVCP